jgi:5'-nucleotidase
MAKPAFRRALAMAAMALAALAGTVRAATVPLTIFAINDLHGNLLPPESGLTWPDPKDPKKKISLPAGGVEYMATLIQQLRRQHPNSVFVAAGDLIGGSPLPSSLFHDEPTIRSMNAMGLDLSSVGNHEFDKGPAELRRIQQGGCAPGEGCKGPQAFTGARFQYLAANVIVKASGKPLLTPYVIRSFQGVPVGFIGLTLQGTGDVVSPRLNASIRFADEAKTVNALVPKLEAQGVKTIILLIHQGGMQHGGINDCNRMEGPILKILPQLNKDVRVIVSGHTHQYYNCVVDGRLLTSAYRFSTIVTEIDLTLDAKTHQVVSQKAQNLPVRDDVAKDPAQTQLIAAYQKLATPIESRVIGHITADLTRTKDAAGEFTLGDVLADGQIAASKRDGKGGAVIAFLNPGGVRVDVNRHAGMGVTFADLFAAQPFGNNLVTLNLTGTEIKSLLEEQWATSVTKILAVSKGFTYSWDASRPMGNRIVAGSMKLNGKPIAPDAVYRIATLDYVADGGDGFTAMKNAPGRVQVMPDIDATQIYFRAHDPIAPPALDRIKRLN